MVYEIGNYYLIPLVTCVVDFNFAAEDFVEV
jgi:hypothetical protein